MTIILFLIDTSASMNARTYLGARPTLLDVSKDAVEKFLKLRQRDIASRGDRYMLLTFEENPANIKAGWKEHHNVFMTELKNLTANGMTTLGPALKNCFDLLNLNRMQTGIDTYGQGRCPYYLEPAVIIVITDGGKLSNTSNVQEELNLPMHSYVPGSELTKEPFRWDQRMFSLVLRLTGAPPPNEQFTNGNSFLPYDNSQIDAMCEVTGGRSYMVNSQRSLNQCLESIVQKVQGGVVIHFEKYGPDPPPVSIEDQRPPNGVTTINLDGEPPNGEKLDAKLSIVNDNPNSHFKSWHTCRKQIYVQRSAQKGYSVGHWPIPEAFWPDLNSQTLAPRTCHPIIRFTCTNNEPKAIEQLPFDKYEIESCPLTNYILLRKQPHVAWQCFISNSSNAGYFNNSKNDLGLPFGYLKASTNLTCVNLYVLPYNYPVLLPLLDDLMKVHHGKPTREWRMNFDAYLQTMPLYYVQPLRRAMQRMSVPNLVPDSLSDNCLSYSISNYLKRLKNQAKLDFEKLISVVGKVLPQHQVDSIKLINNPYTKRLHDLVLNTGNNENLNENTRKLSVSEKNKEAHLKNQKFQLSLRDLNEFNGFALRVRDRTKEAKPQCFKNAFDINRNDLIDQISRMKINFLQKNISDIRVHTEEQLHSLPIAQMGNYQEYLKKVQPSLRELEQQPVRQHMFGNPFKFDKKVQMMVDEADIDLMNNGGNNPNNNNKGLKRPFSGNDMGGGRLIKRKPGPLPRDFVLKRPGSPAPNQPNNLVNSNGGANGLNNGLVQQFKLNDKVGQSSFEPIGKLENENDFTALKTGVNNFDQSLPNSIDSLSDNSLSSSNSSLNELSDDSDLESAPISISNLMNATGHAQPPNKPPTGLHLLSVNSRQAMLNNHQQHQQHQQHSSTANQNNLAGSLINLNDDDVQLKKLLFKIVRRPGNNYEQLIQLLIKHNNVIVKNYLVREVLREAQRFKKKNLEHLLLKKFPLPKSSFQQNSA